MPWNLRITCLPGRKFVMTVHPWRTWTPIFLTENWRPTAGHPSPTMHHSEFTAHPVFTCSCHSNQTEWCSKNLSSSLSLCLVTKSEEYFVAFLFFTNCLLLFTCLVYWKKNTALCQKGKKVVGILGFLFINVTDLVCFCMCGRCKNNNNEKKDSAQTVIVHTCDYPLAFIKCFHTNLISARLIYCYFILIFYIYLHVCRR